MSASLVRLIGTMPVPLFGSARTAALWANAKVRTLPRFAGWVGPLGAGALWFIWPAVDDGWKIQMGIKADPEAAAAAAASAAAAAPKKVELSAAATAKVENAYKAHEHEETEDDKLLAKAASSGDYSELEAKWEAFAEKATRPGEDDDEDEEEEDEDEEEEEDSEEGGEEGEDDDDDDE
ncbi:hypothetical protein ACHAXH_007568 [Discostella pseudostelligera]